MGLKNGTQIWDLIEKKKGLVNHVVACVCVAFFLKMGDCFAPLNLSLSLCSVVFVQNGEHRPQREDKD